MPGLLGVHTTGSSRCINKGRCFPRVCPWKVTISNRRCIIWSNHWFSGVNLAVRFGGSLSFLRPKKNHSGRNWNNGSRRLGKEESLLVWVVPVVQHAIVTTRICFTFLGSGIPIDPHLPLFTGKREDNPTKRAKNHVFTETWLLKAVFFDVRVE